MTICSAVLIFTLILTRIVEGGEKPDNLWVFKHYNNVSVHSHMHHSTACVLYIDDFRRRLSFRIETSCTCSERDLILLTVLTENNEMILNKTIPAIQSELITWSSLLHECIDATQWWSVKIACWFNFWDYEDNAQWKKIQRVQSGVYSTELHVYTS